MTPLSTNPNPDAPLSFADVLQEECARLHPQAEQFPKRVEEITDQLLKDFRSTRSQADDPLSKQREGNLPRQAVYQAMHEQSIKPSALCFSGGGIRSATFNLGVIQALAKLNLLDKFDYLSTVSGGGYIGAWLTAWVHRLTPAKQDAKETTTPKHTPPKDQPQSQREGIKAVQAILKNDCGEIGSTLRGQEPPPLAWLRSYSNYLTPKLGFFSADSWTMIGIALRNLLLNWSVLIPLLVAAFMVPRFQIVVLRSIPSTDASVWLLWPGLVLTFPAMVYLHYYRPSISKYRRRPAVKSEQDAPLSTWNFEAQGWFICFCLVPLFLSGYLLTTAWAWYRNALGSLSELTVWSLSAPETFALLGSILHLLPWFTAMIWQVRDLPLDTTGKFLKWRVAEAPFIFLSGGAGGFLLWAVLDTETTWAVLPTLSGSASSPVSMMVMVKDYAEWYAAFSVAGFIGIFLLVATLFIGLTGRFTADHDHEFWGRTGSWFLSTGTVIAGIGALIIFGPGWMAKAGAWTSATIGGAAGILSLLGGFSAKTLLDPSEKADRLSWLTEVGVKIATPLFVVLLIVGLAVGTSFLVKGWVTLLGTDTATGWPQTGQWMPEPYENGPWTHSLALHNVDPIHLFALWLALILIGSVMGICVNVNKFSLHGFYRNRLIRAYLGASRGLSQSDRRTSNQFTGFDPADNIYMAELAGHKYDATDHLQAANGRGPTPIQVPFHVVNIALNLVRADNLAWQQRKAQSFTVSPLYCGSWQNVGYRRSQEYGYNTGVNRAISMGTAIATSGAAASPNMGYHSSTSVTFLLALFNIRLGWWIGNPGVAGGRPPFRWIGVWLNHVISFLPWQTLRNWLTLEPAFRRACPGFSVWPLLAELFGFTTSDSRYVYLSDGGHFENLALYEMVLRRCHHIVVIDAGCDPEMSFQDLGNAIRKIRIDQGVDIEIDTTMLKRQSGSSVSRWHHAIGSIRYDKVDDGAPIGTLIYIKPSLTGDEPSDVQDYLAHHPTFPHEPTSDQFFDESQFESYRRLGEHITWEVFRHGFK